MKLAWDKIIKECRIKISKIKNQSILYTMENYTEKKIGKKSYGRC
jgi:hypothetical protein